MQAGLDSLGAIELRNAVATYFSVALPATAMFDYPNAAALATFLLNSMTHAEAGDGPHSDIGRAFDEKSPAALAIAAVSSRFPGGRSHASLSLTMTLNSRKVQSWL